MARARQFLLRPQVHTKQQLPWRIERAIGTVAEEALCQKGNNSSFGAELSTQELQHGGSFEPGGTECLHAQLRKASRRGGWSRALHVWWASRCSGHSTLTTDDSDACTAALGAMARGGRAAEAVALLHEMRAACVHPNHAAIGSAVAACTARGAWEEAYSLLFETERWHNGVGAVAYNAVIAACGRAGSCDVALQLLARMEDQQVHHTVVTYGAAIGACSRAHEQWGSGDCNPICPSADQDDEVGIAIQMQVQDQDGPPHHALESKACKFFENVCMVRDDGRTL